jgi:hypothetical protein
VRRLTPAREQRIHQLLTHEEISDHKPSQLLWHLRSLVPDVPDDFLRPIWASRLPPNIQVMLAFQPESSLDSADRASEVASQPELATVEPNLGNTTLLQKIEDPTHQVAALTAKQDRLHTNFRGPRSGSGSPRPIYRNRLSGGRSPSRKETSSNICWYHCHYDDRARICTQPCTYRQQQN